MPLNGWRGECVYLIYTPIIVYTPQSKQDLGFSALVPQHCYNLIWSLRIPLNSVLTDNLLSLFSFSGLSKLDISDAQITTDQIPAIAPLIETSTSLTDLNLSQVLEHSSPSLCSHSNFRTLLQSTRYVTESHSN